MGACFSPYEGDQSKAGFVISLGGAEGTEKAAYLTDSETLGKLKHTIHISGGPGPEQTVKADGVRTITIWVRPGTWTITVQAYLGDLLYATGSVTAELKAGRTNPVKIQMNPADGFEREPVGSVPLTEYPFTINFSRSVQFKNGDGSTDANLHYKGEINLDGGSVIPLDVSGTDGAEVTVPAGNVTVTVEAFTQAGTLVGIGSVGGTVNSDGTSGVTIPIAPPEWVTDFGGPPADGDVCIVFTDSDAISALGTYLSGKAGSGKNIAVVVEGTHTHTLNSITLTNRTGISLRGSGTMQLDATGGGMFNLDANNAGNKLILRGPKLVGQSGNTTSLVNVFNDNKLVMYDGSEIRGNTHTGGVGGGVNVLNAEFVMYGGTISGNSANDGGGVYVSGAGSSFTMSGGTINGNGAATGSGGGVYIGTNSSFTMSGGTIGGTASGSGNTAQYGGGGVFFSGTTFDMSGTAQISGNSSFDFNLIGGGGGVYVNSYGTFNMSGGAITHNTNTCGLGGGVFITDNGIFIMSDGTISNNKVTRTGDGLIGGGGVDVGHGIFTMSGGSIRNNTASGTATGNDLYIGGGGVAVGGGSFTMSSGTICGNTVINESESVTAKVVGGGGVCALFDSTNSASFKMSGGIIYGNTVSGLGTIVGGGGVGICALPYSGSQSVSFKMSGGIIVGSTPYSFDGTSYAKNTTPTPARSAFFMDKSLKPAATVTAFYGQTDLETFVFNNPIEATIHIENGAAVSSF